MFLTTMAVLTRLPTGPPTYLACLPDLSAYRPTIEKRPDVRPRALDQWCGRSRGRGCQWAALRRTGKAGAVTASQVDILGLCRWRYAQDREGGWYRGEYALPSVFSLSGSINVRQPPPYFLLSTSCFPSHGCQMY